MIAGADGIIGNKLYHYYNGCVSLTTIGFYDKNGRYTYSGDLSDRDTAASVAKACYKPDILIFLIGLAHAKGKGKDLSAFQQVNYQTLVNLVTALKTAGKTPSKIVFASTISVYGERYNQDRYDETLMPIPFSPYAVTKLYAEQYLKDNFLDKSWILRFAPVYSSKFLLNINRRTKISNIFYKIGNGTKKLSLCNIDNIKAAVEGIIDGVIPAGIYNISDSMSYSYNDLLNYQGASFIFRIPVLAIRLLYILGRITNNIFLKENSTKLITDNIFPSDKIQKYIKLNSTISDLKISND